MALETQDDYQDKIDDLNKEIEKLYDEGTDKGFKLKREEEMDQEQRALKTEGDYQKAYDKIKSQIKTYNTNLAKIEAEIKKLDEEADAMANSIVDLTAKGIKIAKEGESKGFKVKRGEDMDFEARKQEVLNSLEARALETEKDYQNKIETLRREAYNSWVSVQAGIDKSYYKVKSLVNEMEDLKAEAEKKGLSIKDEPIKSAKLWLKALDKGMSLF